MPKTHPPPWGNWATWGWYGLVLVLSMSAAAFVVTVDRKPDAELLRTIVQDAIQIGALACVARLARWPAGEYLGLVRPNRRDTVIALASLALFIPGWEALGYLLGKTHPPFQDELFLGARTSGALPLLLFTWLAAAPVSEEIIFRGFLFRGLGQQSQYNAISATSVIWAISHMQYDWFGQLNIFLLGLLLGWVRWRSGSTALTVLMHGIWNLWVTLATVYNLEWLADR
jgi:uncharacterized protein